jgi:B12 binding domain
MPLPMATVPEESRQPFSHVLEAVFHGNKRLCAAIALLAEPTARPAEAALDSQVARTQNFVGAVDAELMRLGRPGHFALQAATGDNVTVPKVLPAGEMLVDVVARWLQKTLNAWPDRAIALAVATGRLIEEAGRLNPERRRMKPLGVGFDDQLELRLRLRFGLLGEELGLFVALDQHEVLLLEAPSAGLQAIEDEVGRSLLRHEREWLDAERFVRMLERSRATDEKYWHGQIRWYLRQDPDDGIVLDRHGARGHWLVVGKAGPGELARAGVLTARVTDEERAQDAGAWRALVVGRSDAPAKGGGIGAIEEAHTLRAERGRKRDPREKGGDSKLTIGEVVNRLGGADTVRAGRAIARAATATAEPPTLFSAPAATTPTARQTHWRYELVVHEGALHLTSVGGKPGHRPLAQVALDPDDDPMLDFQAVLHRAAQGAPIIDRVDAEHAVTPAVRWARALLARPAPPTSPDPDDLTDLKVRLVYVPASLEHPLGGLPTIGLRYLADHLERLGARADVMTLDAADMKRRRVELLGADVIGLSTYLTNYNHITEQVNLLREAGFAGRIVLGGPHLREIDLIQEEIEGWDALIRGEGEEVFPQVVRVLRRFDADETDRALELARTLRGVTLARGDLIVLADTAARNGANRISCPLPFEWQRHNEPGTLKMNFTRGCPYECGFCPNHQGRSFHSCSAVEMWSFTERAAADALILPAATEEEIADTIQVELGIEGPPRLRPALDLLLRDPVSPSLLEKICGPVESTAGDRIPRWEAKQRWLASKAEWLENARRRDSDDGIERDPERAELPRFEIMTSEDNTLVNDETIGAYLRLRRQSGLADAVTFDPGQNTVRDLTDRKGAIKYDYVDALCDQNPFKVALGVDATSNPVLRQIQKPYYSIGEAVALNRALIEGGAVEVVNNYILLAPETNLLEAIESFALFVLLPLTWRDHKESINLRIIKEPGTRSHDEGLLFLPEPGEDEHSDPLRYPDVDALLKRWELTSEVHSADLPDLLWRLLANDPDAKRLLPQVVQRWQRNLDHDPFLVGLARRIAAVAGPGKPLVAAFRQVAAEYAAAWPAEPGAITPKSMRPQGTIPAEKHAKPQRALRRDRPSIPAGTKVPPKKRSGVKPGSS